MERAEKPEVVAALKKQFNDASLVIVSKQSGLTVSDVNKLRGALRPVGASYTTAKNTLSRLAVRGTQCADLEASFTGPTAVTITSGDPVAGAKALSDYANTNDKISIVAGMLNGKVLTAEQVKALAKLPSLDQLRGQLIGIIQAPAGKIARVVQAPAAQIARVLGAYSRKDS